MSKLTKATRINWFHWRRTKSVSFQEKSSCHSITPKKGVTLSLGVLSCATLSVLFDAKKKQKTKLLLNFVSSFYWTQVNLGSDLWVRMSVRPSVTEPPLWALTDMTLADDDTDPILTDNANRAIQGNVSMQVTQPGSQLCKQYKWGHLMTKFWTSPSCATWWQNLQLMQVAPSDGQNCY